MMMRSSSSAARRSWGSSPKHRNPCACPRKRTCIRRTILEVHDLLVSKSIAGREKDFAFLHDAAKHGLADRETLLHRLETVEAQPAIRASARTAIERTFRDGTDALR
jgi:hypothetical protein